VADELALKPARSGELRRWRVSSQRWKKRALHENGTESGVSACYYIRRCGGGSLRQEEKLSGRYGHNAKQLHHFSLRLGELRVSGAVRFDLRAIVTRKHKTNQLSGIEPSGPSNTG
jgi:hypothetical protein